MESTISRYEALKQIDTGKAFSLVFINADRTRGTGGKRVEVVNWVKIVNPDLNMKIPGRTLTQQEKKNLKKELHQKERGIMFNIYNPLKPSQHITAVHYALMTFFNGKRIID